LRVIRLYCFVRLRGSSGFRHGANYTLHGHKLRLYSESRKYLVWPRVLYTAGLQVE
jgi:hypothetical protein